MQVAGASFLVVVSIGALPSLATAQRRIDFETWTAACLADGLCGETSVELSSADLTIAPDCGVGAGACLDVSYPYAGSEYRLHPEPVPWVPDPERLAVSFYVQLSPDFVGSPDPPRTFVELVRVYTRTGEADILLEYHNEEGPELAWQLESAEDVVESLPCRAPIVPDDAAHLVEASIAMTGTGGDGALEECEIRIDGVPMTTRFASALWLVGGSHVSPLHELVVGGAGGVGGTSSVRFDEICLGAVPEDCGWSSTTVADAGPYDGGASDAAPDTGGGRPDGSATGPGDSTFRGGGGCTCDTARRGAPDPAAPLSLLFLLSRSRRRRRPLRGRV